MNKARLKKIWKHGTTVLLGVIIIILLVPSWRVSFQGWFQGLFLTQMELKEESNTPLPINVLDWVIYDDQNTATTFRNYTNKPTVLTFWATWCPPCRAELKELKTLKENYNGKVNFVSVSEESNETVKKSGLTESYDFLYTTQLYPQFFEIQSYPTLCIINKHGELIFKHAGAGALDNEKNRDFLDGLVVNG